jgi:hypothetical protein
MDIEDFIAQYGDRGKIVLKAIYEEAVYPSSDTKLGDFSFKSLKRRLNNYGLNYNPSPLLRILEREVGLIETSYKSSNQHWWKITNLNLLRRIVENRVYEDDPRIRLFRIQFYSIDPLGVLEYLKKVSKKRRLLESDKRKFRSIVFDVLPVIVRFMEETEEYEEELSIEREISSQILDLAETVSYKLSSSANTPKQHSLFKDAQGIGDSSKSISDERYSFR